MRKSLPLLGLLLATLSSPAQQQLPPFEATSVTLDAAAILQPQFLVGPNFSVRRAVPTSKGINTFTIDSTFGVFTAQGNFALLQRLAEIQAIARLKEVSRTDSYQKALSRAATSPLKLAETTIKHPVDTVGNIGKGVWKMVNGAGQSVKEIGQGRKQSSYEDSTAEDVIGFSAAKRQIAISLGVDPYSTNPVLQKELKGVAWAAYAGQLTFSAALMPIGGPAGLTLRSVNTGGQTLTALRDLSPSDLRLRNLKILLAIGIDRTLANAFLNSTALSPTHQTVIVDSLNQMPGTLGRARFISLAAKAKDETEAIRYAVGARLLAVIHVSQPIAALSNYGDIPLAQTRTGTLIAPLFEWDYAPWTQVGQRFINAVKTGSIGNRPSTSVHIYLTGVASPSARSALAFNLIGLTEKSLPGPLR